MDSYATKVRHHFIKVLTNEHKIQVKERLVRIDGKEIGFYLLHLKWDVLIEEAERLKLKVPLKVTN